LQRLFCKHGRNAHGSIHPQGWVPIETDVCVRSDELHRNEVAFTPKGGCPSKRVILTVYPDGTIQRVAFTPKGGCPLKQAFTEVHQPLQLSFVAFTPKGGCPLKPPELGELFWRHGVGSIHPQGWVPIETRGDRHETRDNRLCVAFTPKGGCPLKLGYNLPYELDRFQVCSIHPQGWVPIETGITFCILAHRQAYPVAFTPKGGCPLKPDSWISPSLGLQGT